MCIYIHMKHLYINVGQVTLGCSALHTSIHTYNLNI